MGSGFAVRMRSLLGLVALLAVVGLAVAVNPLPEGDAVEKALQAVEKKFTNVQHHLSSVNYWKDYCHTYNLTHWAQIEGAEALKRFNTFKDNLAMIEKHNAEFLKGLHTYELRLNEYAHLTWEEFSRHYLGYLGVKHDEGHRLGRRRDYHVASSGDLPEAIDWRDKGVVTEAKNQGMCGSCWAFSAVCSLEGAHALATGNLVSLSEQQLVDCSKSFGNYGCSGGLMDQAFQYWINKTHGDDTESSYPYAGKDSTCKFKPSSIGATITGYKDIQEGNEDDLEHAAATVGPISVAIHAGASLQFYFRGIYNGVLGTCGGPMNHGVAVVGYGEEPAKFSGKMRKYWIVKNSWGKNWGDHGFVKFAKGKNLCKIANDASYPIVQRKME